MNLTICLSIATLLGSFLTSIAQAEVIGHLDCNVLASGSGRALIFSPKGEILWSHRAGNIHDVQLLPNGNIMYADGNIHEVTRDHKEVFTYRPKIQKGGGAYSFRRLSNGNTVIAENGSGRIVELDPKGKEIVAFTTKFNPKSNPHTHLRFVRPTDKGTYVVAICSYGEIHEYDKTGKLIWKVKTPGFAFQGLRMPNGNTLASSLDEITEYAPDKSVVWQFKKTDLPDAHISNITGFQLLPNGNILIGCYRAYTKEGKGTGLFEITRDKKCIWRYISPNRRDGSMMGMQKLIQK